MRYLKTTIPFFVLTICSSLAAQNGALLKSEGQIPAEFITSSSTKYEKQLESLDAKKTKEKRKQKRNKKQFILESNFAIDDILQSGLVLFNDPATEYANKVLNNLPYRTDKKLAQKELRVYVLNTSAVNAFATDQGIIFVTMGLLANLENEAQLAFILSHELIHVKHQHSINKFINSKDIDRNRGQSDRNVDQISFDRNVFKKSLYSIKLEEKADEEGLEIFLNSNYDPTQISNTFKILHYSYLPYEDDPFEKSFFEDEYFVFPENLWTKNLNPISSMEEDREKEASHPSSLKRLKKLESSVNGALAGEKNAFILPEADFKNIRQRARYQIPFLNLYSENFPEAIYTSFLTLKEFPDDLELRKVIGKSLYMLVKHQVYSDSDEDPNVFISSVADKTEGSIHQIYHLLGEINRSALLSLATKYNWSLYKNNQDDEELKIIVEDLFIELVDRFDNLNVFSTSLKPQLVEKDSSTVIKEENSQSKLDKIEASNEANDFWQYAFVTELKEDAFKQQYEKGLSAFEERKKREEYYESKEGRKQLQKELKKESKSGKQLGIDKIVVINPFYLSLDERNKGGSIQYIRSEEKQVYLRQSIKDVAKISKIDAKVLDVTGLSTNEIEQFNDIAEVNQYFSQQMNQYDFSLTPSHNQQLVNDIANKYGTDYFLWTGVISLREKNKGWPAVGLGLIVPYILPFTLLNALTPKYDMLYYAILFDVKTGRRSVLKMDYFDNRDSKTILRTHIYDVFHQIRAKPKKQGK